MESRKRIKFYKMAMAFKSDTLKQDFNIEHQVLSEFFIFYICFVLFELVLFCNDE